MIRYSLTWRRVRLSDDETAMKVYANTQYTDAMDIWEFAQHISSHDSKYNRSDVVGVLTTMVDCLYELLLDGKRVRLGDLGIFYSSIHSKGAESMADFSAESNIIGLTANWSRGSKFENIFKDAKFMAVPTRKGVDEALDKMKSKLPDGTYASSSDDDATDTSGDSSTGDSSTGDSSTGDSSTGDSSTGDSGSSGHKE